MGKAKVLRVRVSARLSIDLRNRLAKVCKGSGIKERTVIEDALEKYLNASDDTALILRRFDRMERAMARDHRHLELLSEAFARYMRLWFTAHKPNMAEAGKGDARSPGEAQYSGFAQHVGAMFKQGHRFVDDLPIEASEQEDEG
jgi:hypothetical protein